MHRAAREGREGAGGGGEGCQGSKDAMGGGQGGGAHQLSSHIESGVENPPVQATAAKQV